MMNTRKKLLAILLSVFMLVSVMPLSLAVTVAAEESGADNRVVYVSTDGSDSTGNGTAGNPYATLSKAMTVIEADGDATTGTIIISEDNDGAGIAFTSAAHTKMITIEGVDSSILIDASNSETWRQTQGPLTFDNISVKRLGLEPRGHELILKEGVILEGVGNGRLNVRVGYNTKNGDTVYMGAYQHDTNTKDVYMYIGSGTVTGDLNIYINDIYAKSVDIRNATYNGNVNLTVNNYRKSTNSGDDLWIGTGATISGALQVILNNGVRNIHKDYFRDRGPSGRTWLLYGETAVDGTILEMSDTVGVYNVKGDMTANAYKVTATSNDFSDTLSETAIVSNDGVLDLRESGAGEYFIRYTYNRTVYVSTDGSDSTGDGTAENPYATLSKAMTVIEDDTAAVAGTIIISGDNAGEGIAFTAAAHTKMITVEGITPSIVIVGNDNTKYKNIFGPLTIDNVTFKNLGLNPYGYKLVLKDGVTFDSLTNIHTGKTESGGSVGTVSGVDVYIDAEGHSTYQDALYLTVGKDNAYTVNGDVNLYINDMYSQGLDIEKGTYNGNVNLTVNHYRKSSNGGDDIYLRNNGTVSISGALQVVLNNGVTTGKYKANFRDGGPSGKTWLLYGETAADGTILEMSDTVGVYNVKGGMTANAYKVTTSTSNFANDTVSETAITSNDGILDLREAGAGEYYIHYTPVAFKTHSLVLTDAIGVNFHMGLGGLTEEEKAASYMTFAIDNQAEEQRMDFVDTFTSGENYGFTCFISSVQMAENITPTFHFGNGETVTGSAFSAKDYIDYVAANSGSFPSSVVTLVKALGDYGHYAQIYLGGRNGWTAGTQYTALAKYRAADYGSDDYSAKLSALSSAAVSKDISGTAVTGLSYSLNFDSNTYVNVELKTTDSIFASATVNGKLLYLSASGKLRTQGLSVLQLGEPITITGKGSDNTNTFTITLSGLSYIRGILGADTSTAAKNAVSALYDYYQAARTYEGL